MRKLNGITINGEYLGNSVVINGMFRAICTISPVIMRDFILIINKIDRLEDAVKIHNFNCGFDCIDIEFENKTSKGMASLYFKLHDGEPLLKDCKLVIDNEEYSTFQEKIKLRSKKDMTNPNKPVQGTQNSELDRLQKIRELREKKQAMQRQQSGGNNSSPAKNSPIQNSLGSMNRLNPAQNSQGSLNRVNPANLSPEQQRENKRQELMEKKRRLMEAKKAKTEEAASIDSAVRDSVNGFNSTENREEISEVQNKETNIQTSAKNSESKNPQPVNKPASIVTHEDGSITNEQGQTVVKEERVNPDGTVSEVYVNPENPEEVYEQNENGEFVSNNVPQEDFPENDGFDEDISGENYENSGSSILENLSDEDLENMSDEELAALEAELNSELGEDSGYNNYDDFSADVGGYQSSNFNMEGFAQELAQGLTQGLTQGLSQGLAQGFAQGFSSLASQGGGGFAPQGGGFAPQGGGFAPQGGGFENSFEGNYSNAQQSYTQPQVQQIMPDYSQIDNINSYASESARNSYDYDENSNVDDIADFYSDFYDEAQTEMLQNGDSQQGGGTNGEDGAPMSEIDILKAELEALKAQGGEQKDLMSVEEFMAKQQELKEQKEKLSRQKMRIVGSSGRVNASALDGGVFAAGKKLYKWGDTRVLDE